MPPSAVLPDLPEVDSILARSNEPMWQRLTSLPRNLRAGRLGESVLLLKYADGQAVLTSRDFEQGILGDLSGSIPAEFVERRRRSLLHLRGANLAKHRNLAMPGFRPKTIEGMRPLMRRVILDLLNKISPDAPCDGVAELTHPYPIPITCALLGIPAKDHQFISTRGDAWVAAMFDPAAIPAGLAAHREIDAYITRLIERRRSDPADDLLTGLISAENQPGGLTTAELVALVAALAMAGTDTPRIQFANDLEFLARNPAIWAELRENAKLIPAAVDELARLGPVTSFLRRTAVRDTELDGLTIPAGTNVILAIAAMNRDPEVFADPDRFDLTRTVATLSYGGGPHFCLGRQLGRAKLHEAFSVLTREVAVIRPAGPPTWREPRSFQGPTHLPLRLIRAA